MIVREKGAEGRGGASYFTKLPRKVSKTFLLTRCLLGGGGGGG